MMPIFTTSKLKNDYDVFTTDMKSAGIHLLKQYSFRHTQPFSFLDKSTGPILPFMVLALCLPAQRRKSQAKVKFDILLSAMFMLPYE